MVGTIGVFVRWEGAWGAGVAANFTGSLPWVRPDGKTQVTIEYKEEGGAMKPVRVHTIVVSIQHSLEVGYVTLRRMATCWGVDWVFLFLYR